MKGKLDPSALSIRAAVKVLRAAGAEHVSEESVRADVEAGAPANPNGTMNLVHYCAWLAGRVATRNGRKGAAQRTNAAGRSVPGGN